MLPSLDFSDSLKPATRGFGRCTTADSAEFKKATKGRSIEGCVIFLADNGTGAPTAVEWTPDDKDKPIATWM
ncbi:hypothetical protein DY245_23265 [Streptomyces inhibens]|uniref:Uncharacterized protein n=1 Tax=Streptomyces inhibens TaxID=2293571 RepID=A0A371Q098_STRIH|nr:hypothetical protein [Streptomyces inhibens]REK88069.1 hypothetical protein DY245_23265 [Streptomyces inhibens]